MQSFLGSLRDSFMLIRKTDLGVNHWYPLDRKLSNPMK